MKSELNQAPAETEDEPAQPAYRRRVASGSWHTQPDGSRAHFLSIRDATPEEEAWYQIHDPMRGLQTEADRAAYRQSKRGPVMRFLAGLKFWHKKVDDDTFVVPAFLRHQSD